MTKLTLYCDDVSSSSVHCNRYKDLNVSDMDKTVSTIINESSWEYDPGSGNTYCEEHS